MIESQDTINLNHVIPYLVELQKQKGAMYGRSYCKHGDLSIFFNLERKWDRISNMVDKAIASGNLNLLDSEVTTATESFADTVIDLANYSLLWVGYIYEKHPEVFDAFIKSNKLEYTTNCEQNNEN